MGYRQKSGINDYSCYWVEQPENNGARVSYHWMGKPETKSHFDGGGINSYGVIILNWIGGKVRSLFQFIF